MFLNYINQYLEKYQNYQHYFNYEDGCILLGAKELYEVTNDERYFNFIENYLKRFITEEGTIQYYDFDKFNIDSINSGKILFFMYEKTGEEKYRKAIEVPMEQLRQQPRCACGNFFHKKIYAHQIWLDGLFMAQPFYMEYETKFNQNKNYNDIVMQFENVQKYLYAPEKGLNYHACDMKKQMFWANKETGCSANFWLRSMGWYLMALVDTLDQMSKQIYEQYRKLEDIFRLMIKGILPYQDPNTKMFYQVIDHPEVKENYLETSGSAMIAYAIIKGCRMGILLDEKYASTGIEIMEGILANKLIQDADGNLHLIDTCLMAGLGPENNLRRDGSIAYYLSEPRVSDEAKGVGPMMMAYGQYLKYKKEM